MTKEEILHNRAIRITSIKAIEAKTYLTKNCTKREAKTIFQSFEPVVKEFVTDFFEPSDLKKKARTGKHGNILRKVNIHIRFPKGIIGKLRGFFSIRKANIILYIRDILKYSQYAYSTNYTINDTRYDGSIHKEKTNIEAYHHFINKVTIGNIINYVRFTIEELKNEGQLHSVQISEAKLINSHAVLDFTNELSREKHCSLLGKHQGGTALQPAYDYNLIDFFNSVK